MKHKVEKISLNRFGQKLKATKQLQKYENITYSTIIFSTFIKSVV